MLVAQAQMVVRRRVAGVGLDHPLETLDGGLDPLLALADEAQVVEGDDVLGIHLDRPLEGARRVVEASQMEERDGEAEVGRRRHRVELDRLAGE